MNDVTRWASEFFKSVLKNAGKQVVKAFFKKVLLVLGIKGVFFALLFFIVIGAVSSIFDQSGLGGFFTGDETQAAQLYDKQLKSRYIKLSDSTVKPLVDEYGQEQGYKMSWGLLAALDKLANNCENPVPEDNVRILGPRFSYKDSIITTVVKHISEDNKKNSSNSNSTTASKQLVTYTETKENIKLLETVDTYQGVYVLKYKTVTEHPDDKTSVTKEVFLGVNYKPDYTRLKNRIDELGLNPDSDFDFAIALARTFNGDDPELALDTELDDIDYDIGFSGKYTEPGDPSIYGFIWPAPGYYRITSDFGPRKAPVPGASTYHNAIDIGCPKGSTVVASKGGTVAFAERRGNAGNLLIINHGNGVFTKYLHLNNFLVSVGDVVSAGQAVAKSGNTGIGSGAHLDFRILIGGSYVNPSIYVSP
jgi:murein DD-endopeptidase MepM/ murein hydrolase activator NlpD